MTISSTFTDTDSQDDNGNLANFAPINNSIQKILDAFPQPTALLDLNEKIISVNLNFVKLFSFSSKDNLIGKKPIEIFNCLFAIDTICDSKNADHCSSCGVNLSLKGSKVTSQQFNERCHLTFADETGHIDDLHNIKVTTSPFTLDGEQFHLFSVTDISNDVRRKLLEKIFFHDVLNKAGNIIGILDVLNLIGNDDKRSDELYASLKNTSHDLITEIKYQRDLVSAENNELTPVFSFNNSLDILHATKSEIVNSDVAYDREIHISSKSTDCQIVTDCILLRRVLINMLKNALEATQPGGKVSLGCELLNPKEFRFWVHNESPISAEIQLLLFNKTNSTKGTGRGLGTFSMRLIGEKYLKGKVNFISSEETGTYFMIDIPLMQ